MAKHQLKCTICGHEFSADTENATCVCPNCNKEISVDKAIKYLLTLSKINLEKKKVAEGDTYLKVDRLLEEADYYVKNGYFDKALEIAEKAEGLTTVDYRVYFLKVVCKTKHFEDVDDVSHYSDFKKALECASYLQKEELKQIYAPFYRKQRLPKEEKIEYEKQEAQSILKRVEENLKAEIPRHFSSEKYVKVSKFINIAVAVLFLTSIILSIVLENVILSLVAGALFIALIIFLTTHLSKKYKTTTFNAGLDFYDLFENLNLFGRDKIKTAQAFEEFSVSALNGESPSRQESLLAKTLFYAFNSNSESAKQLIKEDNRLLKILSKYYE